MTLIFIRRSSFFFLLPFVLFYSSFWGILELVFWIFWILYIIANGEGNGFNFNFLWDFCFFGTRWRNKNTFIWCIIDDLIDIAMNLNGDCKLWMWKVVMVELFAIWIASVNVNFMEIYDKLCYSFCMNYNYFYTISVKLKSPNY